MKIIPKRYSLTFSCVTLALFSIAIGNNCFGQRPRASVETLGVDEVKLESNQRMYGIVLNRTRKSGGGVTLMVERDWFKETYPAKYAEHLKAEAVETKAAGEMLIKRLMAWKDARIGDERVAEFVDAELDYFAEQEEKKSQAKVKAAEEAGDANVGDGAEGEKAEAGNADQAKKIKDQDADLGKAKGKEGPTFFAIVRYKSKEIRGVFLQPDNHRMLAGIAWKHDVPRVTVRNVKALRRELEKRKVDIDKETFDFTEEVPALVTQTDEEWAGRIAVLEYGLREPVNFQGMGSMLMRIDPKQTAQNRRRDENVRRRNRRWNGRRTWWTGGSTWRRARRIGWTWWWTWVG